MNRGICVSILDANNPRISLKVIMPCRLSQRLTRQHVVLLLNINFKILFEIISGGGGNVHTLISLADISEKIHGIEKTKRELLKPYIMIGFILMGMTGLTTLLVIDSFGDIAQESNDLANLEEQVAGASLGLFPFIVLIQSWTAGLFLGRVIKGAFSGGFLYSIILVVMTLIGITLVQFSIIDVNSIF